MSQYEYVKTRLKNETNLKKWNGPLRNHVLWRQIDDKRYVRGERLKNKMEEYAREPWWVWKRLKLHFYAVFCEVMATPPFGVTTVWSVRGLCGVQRVVSPQHLKSD